MNTSKCKGMHYEAQAKTYLCKKGLIVIEQNYHCRFGEIDLIMKDQDTICFVEVKYRRNMSFGGAMSAISHQKQQKIIKTAQVFIAENRRLTQKAIRFDALILQQGGEDISINWIQNAFYAE